MKNRLTEILDRSLKINLGKMFLWVMTQKEVQDVIVNLHKAQMGKGVGADDQSLGEYSDVSVNFYGKPTQSNPFLDVSGREIVLYDTGAFYDSFTVANVTEAAVTISNQDRKDDGTVLTSVYGNLAGLSTESLYLFANFVVDHSREFLINYLHGDIQA